MQSYIVEGQGRRCLCTSQSSCTTAAQGGQPERVPTGAPRVILTNLLNFIRTKLTITFRWYYCEGKSEGKSEGKRGRTRHEGSRQ